MRQVVLDTETTGLEVSKGHRIIEIGCVELMNRRRTNRTFQRYIQPDRDIDPAAEEVHGITRQRLADEPRFPDVADEFIEFISGAELIIHNADFDVGFLNHEFQLAALQTATISDCCAVVDTLALARRLHPGQRNNLDALCKRYFVDNTGRDFHGALLDAQLLADVYLAMTGGQGALSLDTEGERRSQGPGVDRHIDRTGIELTVVRATAAELEGHQRQLDLIDEASVEGALWRKTDA
jgi:DNA polymerase-3 subunit epsilon